MNRKMADCEYQTRGEYEGMIRHYEKEMRSGREYSRREESSLLENIRKCKKGIETLAEYETKRKICDQLDDSLSEKKRQRDVSSFVLF